MKHNGFGWLDETPEDWEIPDELLAPTRYIESNLAIKMLSCEVLDHEVLELLGQFIAEQSRLNMWFLQNVKESDRDVKETLMLSGFGLEQVRLVYEVWRGFESVLESGDGDDKRARIVAGNLELVEVLRTAVEALVRVRSSQ